ncbi:endo alpha-1,4 polygalactosaminidase [Streptomyces toyocaensis]|uniref:Endo alpha-1,4 polygalactosaminidase n=1 Tax=Streptomyces toyocaensis TaxID=55952 RepID=A0A081XYQ7_STRTO|nr:endo alpha-1,4 polygalactosaminidase [Streptomyces toyocaensis]
MSGCSGPDRTGSTGAGSGPARTASAAPPPGPRASPSPPRPSHTPGGTRWRPRPGLSWQWQLDGRADPSADVPVYDIDGFENTARDVARLHREGRKVICYVNVGAWEEFRPDRDAFPRSVLGRPNGWRGERWLDIRRVHVLRPIMERRFDMCRDKGFDAVEPDLVEGYGNDTGFPLTAGDQLRYNRMIADIAHDRGLSVGLKNDLPQIPQLVDHFDFAVNEECAQYGECAELSPFVEAGKAVFHVEYSEPTGAFCGLSRQLGLSSMRKKPELGVWRDPC